MVNKIKLSFFFFLDKSPNYSNLLSSIEYSLVLGLETRLQYLKTFPSLMVEGETICFLNSFEDE